jgi:hypothetical protein
MPGKWNYETHSYDPYNPNFKLILMAELDDIVNCSQCGAELKYGDCYTSKEIHTEIGLGYPVCEDCYNKEIQRDRESHGRV